MTAADRVRRALERVLAAEPPASAPVPSVALAETRVALDPEVAGRSLARDPYWPKWDSPWWRMTLLIELGLAAEVPVGPARELARGVDRYLHVFPFRLEDVPAGVDPVRGIPCHCALGTADRVLAACGVDIDRDLVWVRPWYLRYQVADGGWNCDEAAYLKDPPRSSMVSTLPVCEALAARQDATREETAALDRAAAYLLARRLCRSLSKGGALIDPAWLEPSFPRFYHYDVLRGLTFVTRWARRRGSTVPADAVEEVALHLAGRTRPDGTLPAGRRPWDGARTLAPDAGGTWTRGHPARSFPLLDAVGIPGEPEPRLTAEWRSTARDLLATLG
jgi:hypothetical protein